MNGTPAPLTGVRVVEMAGIGPSTHTGMMLADLGADVVRIVRPRGALQWLPPGADDLSLRGRRLVRADVKTASGLSAVLDLVDLADVLIDGFRPGVMERLGLGPDVCRARNPRLIYGRVTGWGQQGPLAQRAGHDINYVGLTGALAAMGRPGTAPPVPLNLVGDFGGGSCFLLVGILAALHERSRSGLGQVIDAAMIDGVASLAQSVLTMVSAGSWVEERGANLLDGGAPFYDTYECADGRYVAVGAIEPAFFRELVRGLGLDEREVPEQYPAENWPGLRRMFTAAFRTRSRDEWAGHFADRDACVTPVLTFAEAAVHPQCRTRGTYHLTDASIQAAPAPRFSRSPLRTPQSAGAPEPAGVVVADWARAASGAGADAATREATGT